MVDYEAGCPARIQHLTKVYAFATLIALQERCDALTLEIIEAAALVHDIGIKPALAQFGSDEGPVQERLGPPVALEMLNSLSYDPAVVNRVCQLVGRHHTYTDIDGVDCQILIEADFLVNCYEGKYSTAAIESIEDNIFRTATGSRLLQTMFLSGTQK